jgi:putative NADH-flavin reductase
MRIAIFGAHGPTGQLLTRDIIDAGHDAIAITRHPDDYPMTNPHLTVTGADATSQAAVKHALRGADAVVSTLGTGFSRRPIDLYSQSATAIIGAMTEIGARRLVVTSSSAVDSWTDPAWNWLERTIARRVLTVIGRTLYDDMRRMESIVKASELQWTIMRPLGLANIEPPTTYAIAEEHIPGRQTARRDLAAAITDQLARTDYHRKVVAVATTNRSQSIPATIWREAIKLKLLNVKVAPRLLSVTPKTTSAGRFAN